MPSRKPSEPRTGMPDSEQVGMPTNEETAQPTEPTEPTEPDNAGAPDPGQAPQDGPTGEPTASFPAQWLQSTFRKGTTGSHLNYEAVFQIEAYDAGRVLEDELMGDVAYGATFRGIYIGEGLVIQSMPVALDKTGTTPHVAAKIKVSIPQNHGGLDQIRMHGARSLFEGLIGTSGELQLFATQTVLGLSSDEDDDNPEGSFSSMLSEPADEPVDDEEPALIH